MAHRIEGSRRRSVRQRAGHRLAGAVPARRSPTSGPTSPAGPDAQDRRRHRPRLGAARHACEATYGDPVYGGNRDGAGWRAIGFDGDVLTRCSDAGRAGTDHRDRRGLRRRRRRQRARWLDRGRRPHRGGLDGHRAGEGSQPPGGARAAVRPVAATSPTTSSSSSGATSSAPTRCSSLARYRRGRRPTASACIVGEVNNLPSTVGGGGFHADGKLPRFREEDFHAPAPSGARSRAPPSPTGRCSYDGPRAALRRGRAAHRRGRRGRRQPVRGLAQRAYPMPPGPDMFGACSPSAAAERAGLHPYRAPTGVNSVPYDGRPACNNCGFCASLRLPDRTPRATRSPRCSGRCAPAAARSGPRRTSPRSSRDAGGPTRHRRALPRPPAPSRAPSSRCAPPRRCSSPAAPSRPPRLLLRNGLGNSSGLVGRHLMYHFQTFTVGIFPFDAARRAGPRRHPPARRPHRSGHGRAAAPSLGTPACPGSAAARYRARRRRLRPSTRRSSTRRARPQRGRCATAPPTAGSGSSPMQGEDLAQGTNRIDLDPAVRDAWGFAAGRVTYRPHRHELVASDHFAGRSSKRCCADAGRESRLLDARRRHRTRSTATRRSTRSGSPRPAATSWGPAGWATTPPPPSSSPEQRLWDVDNVLICRLVGVRDLVGLQPHAHPGGPGAPGGDAAHSLSASAVSSRKRP